MFCTQRLFILPYFQTENVTSVRNEMHERPPLSSIFSKKIGVLFCGLFEEWEKLKIDSSQRYKQNLAR